VPRIHIRTHSFTRHTFAYRPTPCRRPIARLRRKPIRLHTVSATQMLLMVGCSRFGQPCDLREPKDSARTVLPDTAAPPLLFSQHAFNVHTPQHTPHAHAHHAHTRTYPPLTSVARGVSRGDKAGVVASDALTAASAEAHALDESTHGASSPGAAMLGALSPGAASPSASLRDELVATVLAVPACPSRGAGSRCGCGRATPASNGASRPAAAVASSSCRSCCEAFAFVFARARVRLR